MAARYPDRRFAASATRELVADRKRAQFSTWYELFPRSAAGEHQRHGTFRDVEARLPYVAQLGFDVLYLPPIHPIGRINRKGANNALTAGSDDVGSPWAIGSIEGGHKDILPQLGTLQDFKSLVGKAREAGIDVALDIAFQCAPDHPYVRSHPEWFRHRPDGSVQYAENPPKKYQDIYPFDFESDDWRSLWEELKSVLLYWISLGVGHW
jgi:starch synthase (maltosyl-transferring)